VPVPVAAVATSAIPEDKPDIVRDLRPGVAVELTLPDASFLRRPAVVKGTVNPEETASVPVDKEDTGAVLVVDNAPLGDVTSPSVVRLVTVSEGSVVGTAGV